MSSFHSVIHIRTSIQRMPNLANPSLLCICNDCAPSVWLGLRDTVWRRLCPFCVVGLEGHGMAGTGIVVSATVVGCSGR